MRKHPKRGFFLIKIIVKKIENGKVETGIIAIYLGDTLN